MKMNIKNHYINSYNLIRKNRKIIIFIFILYVVSLSVGIIFYSQSYGGFSSVEVKDAYYQWIGETNNKGGFADNFFYLFFHNAQASLLQIISGIFLGIIPIVLTIDWAMSNSYSLVSFIINNNLPNSLLFSVPHSLFEIPAFILASSFGVTLFLSLFKNGGKIKNLRASLRDSAVVFLLWVLPLLVIAGIVESILIMNYLS